MIPTQKRLLGLSLVLIHALAPSCKTTKNTSSTAISKKTPAEETTKKLSSTMLDDPNNPVKLTEKDVTASDNGTVITYCAKETAGAATPEEKKWRL